MSEREKKVQSKNLKKLMFLNQRINSVLITGAGGSIGSELTKQIYYSNCKNIYILDKSEFNLFSIYEELAKEKLKKNVIPILGDICDEQLIKSIFKSKSIDAVFHVAAYKHVNLLEHNKVSAFKNNVLGTLNLVRFSDKKAKFFYNISTDKAVRPCNVMGATKRLTELIVLNKAKKTKYTKYNVIRFGNVMHSSGSVMPIFKKQIESGMEVTVTDKNATRFFMTIPEAVQLIIKASNIEENGQIYVLDMGKPLKILDLAIDMIKIHGKTPTYETPKDNEVKIKFIGLREGEKINEELTYTKLISTALPGVLRSDESGSDKIILNKIFEKIKKLNDSNVDKFYSNLLSLLNDL